MNAYEQHLGARYILKKKPTEVPIASRWGVRVESKIILIHGTRRIKLSLMEMARYARF